MKRDEIVNARAGSDSLLTDMPNLLDYRLADAMHQTHRAGV